MGWNSDMSDAVDDIDKELKAAQRELSEWRKWAAALAKRLKIKVPPEPIDREVRTAIDYETKGGAE